MHDEDALDAEDRRRVAELLSKSANALAPIINSTARRADSLQKYLLLAFAIKARGANGLPYADLQVKQTRLYGKLPPHVRAVIEQVLQTP